MTKPTFKVTGKIIHIVNAKKMNCVIIKYLSSLLFIISKNRENIMYFVQMSITDILHYVIIFVYVQGQLILCTALLNQI